MNKQDLIEIKARAVIPTAFLKKSVSSDTFNTIVLPLFLKAFHEKDVYMTYQPLERIDQTVIEHKIASDAYIDALTLFYDEPKPEDNYDLVGEFHNALFYLHLYAYRLERHSDEEIDHVYSNEENTYTEVK